MPQATAEKPTQPSKAIGILSPEDLRDPARYKRIPNTPLLDEHEHPKKGNIDARLLGLIAENSNARCAKRNYPTVLLGHTFDGEGREHDQPKPVGVACNFRVDDYDGRACLYADLYIEVDELDESGSYPHRSVERVRSEKDDDWNYIEAVSLLRRAPERHLGLLMYSRDLPAGVTRERYSLASPPGEGVGRERLMAGLSRCVERYARRKGSGLPSPMKGRTRRPISKSRAKRGLGKAVRRYKTAKGMRRHGMEAAARRGAEGKPTTLRMESSETPKKPVQVGREGRFHQGASNPTGKKGEYLATQEIGHAVAAFKKGNVEPTGKQAKRERLMAGLARSIERYEAERDPLVRYGLFGPKDSRKKAPAGMPARTPRPRPKSSGVLDDFAPQPRFAEDIPASQSALEAYHNPPERGAATRDQWVDQNLGPLSREEVGVAGGKPERRPRVNRSPLASGKIASTAKNTVGDAANIARAGGSLAKKGLDHLDRRYAGVDPEASPAPGAPLRQELGELRQGLPGAAKATRDAWPEAAGAATGSVLGGLAGGPLGAMAGGAVGAMAGSRMARRRSGRPNVTAQGTPSGPASTPSVAPSVADRGEDIGSTTKRRREGSSANFTPTGDWQEVPEGTVLPPGLQHRMDMKSGKNYARTMPGQAKQPSQKPQQQPQAAQDAPPEGLKPQTPKTPDAPWKDLQAPIEDDGERDQAIASYREHLSEKSIPELMRVARRNLPGDKFKGFEKIRGNPELMKKDPRKLYGDLIASLANHFEDISEPEGFDAYRRERELAGDPIGQPQQQQAQAQAQQPAPQQQQPAAPQPQPQPQTQPATPQPAAKRPPALDPESKLPPKRAFIAGNGHEYRVNFPNEGHHSLYAVANIKRRMGRATDADEVRRLGDAYAKHKEVVRAQFGDEYAEDVDRVAGKYRSQIIKQLRDGHDEFVGRRHARPIPAPGSAPEPPPTYTRADAGAPATGYVSPTSDTAAPAEAITSQTEMGPGLPPEPEPSAIADETAASPEPTPEPEPATASTPDATPAMSPERAKAQQRAREAHGGQNPRSLDPKIPRDEPITPRPRSRWGPNNPKPTEQRIQDVANLGAEAISLIERLRREKQTSGMIHKALKDEGFGGVVQQDVKEYLKSREDELGTVTREDAWNAWLSPDARARSDRMKAARQKIEGIAGSLDAEHPIGRSIAEQHKYVSSRLADLASTKDGNLAAATSDEQKSAIWEEFTKAYEQVAGQFASDWERSISEATSPSSPVKAPEPEPSAIADEPPAPQVSKPVGPQPSPARPKKVAPAAPQTLRPQPVPKPQTAPPAKSPPKAMSIEQAEQWARDHVAGGGEPWEVLDALLDAGHEDAAEFAMKLTKLGSGSKEVGVREQKLAQQKAAQKLSRGNNPGAGY